MLQNVCWFYNFNINVFYFNINGLILMFNLNINVLNFNINVLNMAKKYSLGLGNSEEKWALKAQGKLSFLCSEWHSKVRSWRGYSQISLWIHRYSLLIQWYVIIHHLLNCKTLANSERQGDLENLLIW